MKPAAAPRWFTAALAAPHREGTVESGGCPVHFLEWGEPGLPGLVFVHGGAAHAHWWSFVAPLLADRWHGVALDLSGHGDSGRRPAYSLGAWAGDVAAVAERSAFPGPPVVVGHSLGGLIAVQAACDYGHRLAGAVLVDAPMRRPDPESEAASHIRAFRAPGVYSTREEAVGRFRLVPDQPIFHRFIFDHVAAHSVREVPGGWTWKFDPRIMARPRFAMGERAARAGCRLAVVYGEHSAIVTPEVAAYAAEVMGPDAPVVPIPGAHHHLLLDRPRAFVAALAGLLLGWGHGGPAPAS